MAFFFYKHNIFPNTRYTIYMKKSIINIHRWLGQGMEHMASFDFAYKLAPVRDWLFEQKK